MSVDLRSDFTGRVPLSSSPPTPEGRVNFTVTAGVIDDDAEALFGRGYCHWLAGAIHTLTGWKLVTVDVRVRRGDWQPVHTAVRTPEGRLLDIFGEHTKDDMFDRYLTGKVREARMRTVKAENVPGDVLTGVGELRGNPHWWAKGFSGPYLGVLLHFARLLLRKHGHDHHIRPDGISRRAPDHNHRTDSPAVQATTTSMEGPSMASIDELRAALSSTNYRAEGVQGALAQAAQELREITGTVQQVAQGSGQPAIQEAVGLYAQITDLTDQVLGMVSAARTAVDAYAASL